MRCDVTLSFCFPQFLSHFSSLGISPVSCFLCNVPDFSFCFFSFALSPPACIFAGIFEFFSFVLCPVIEILGSLFGIICHFFSFVYCPICSTFCVLFVLDGFTWNSSISSSLFVDPGWNYFDCVFHFDLK